MAAPAPRRRRVPPKTPHAARLLVAVELAPVLAVQAAWQSRLQTRTAPLAILAANRHIAAVCPRAAAAGVATGQSAAQARLRCPDLRFTPPDRDAVHVLWEEVLTALSGVSPCVEAADAAGLAYLDARGLEGVWGDGVAVAQAALRALDGSDLRARAGVGPTRTMALALARRMGVSGPCALTGRDAHAFLHALPVDDPAFGLPPAVTNALHELGLHTIGAFTALPPAGLGLRFGPAALAAWRLATSGAEPPLRPWHAPESVEIARTLDGGLADAVLLARLLTALSADLAARLSERAQAAAVLTLMLCGENGSHHVARTDCWPPLSTAEALRTTTLALLARLRPTAPVEAATLRAAGLRRPEVHQEELWPMQPLQRRRERLARALDAQARRHDQLRIRRLRPDPLNEEGWCVEDLELSGPFHNWL